MFIMQICTNNKTVTYCGLAAGAPGLLTASIFWNLDMADFAPLGAFAPKSTVFSIAKRKWIRECSVPSARNDARSLALYTTLPVVRYYVVHALQAFHTQIVQSAKLKRLWFFYCAWIYTLHVVYSQLCVLALCDKRISTVCEHLSAIITSSEEFGLVSPVLRTFNTDFRTFLCCVRDELLLRCLLAIFSCEFRNIPRDVSSAQSVKSFAERKSASYLLYLHYTAQTSPYQLPSQHKNITPGFGINISS